jgi:hypothetical protein
LSISIGQQQQQQQQQQNKSVILNTWEHVLAQLVEALCYKPDGVIGIFH